MVAEAADGVMTRPSRRKPRVVPWWVGVVLAVVGLLNSSVSASEITEAEVRTLYERIEDAVNRRNVRDIMSYLADDCIITVVINGQHFRWTREEYEDQVVKGWLIAKTYHYDSDIRQITINGPMAMVESVATEQMITADGQALYSVMHESTLLERVGPSLKVAAVQATPTDDPQGSGADGL
jgi:ketosteroid isomerase-like protein